MTTALLPQFNLWLVLGMAARNAIIHGSPPLTPSNLTWAQRSEK